MLDTVGAPNSMGVDRELISAALEKQRIAKERVEAARAEKARCDQAIIDAERALSEHLSNVASSNSEADLKMMQAVQDATLRASLQARLLGETERLVGEAAVNLKDAMAKAYAGMYQAGRDVRMQASKQADAARAMLAEAEAEFKRGTRIIQDAMQNGALHPGHLEHQPNIGANVATEAREREMWGLEH